MRSGHVIAGVALVASVAIAACTSSTPTTQPSATAAAPIASSSPVPSAAAPSASPPQYILLPNGSPMLGPDGKPLPYPSIPMPSGDQGTQSGPAASLAHGDTGLEATLPKNVGGIPLQTASVTGTALAASPAFSGLATRLGIAPADISVATAFSDSLSLQLGAIKAPGAAATAIQAAYAAAITTSLSAKVDTAPKTVAGRKVTAMTVRAGGVTLTGYLYPKGDVLYFVQAQDASVAETAVAALP